MTQSAEARYFAGVSDLRSHLAQIESPDLWRRINPHLTITDAPFADRKTGTEFSSQDIERARLQICEDGYLHCGPGVSAEDCRALSSAIDRIIEARYHPMFLAVYDEYLAGDAENRAGADADPRRELSRAGRFLDLVYLAANRERGMAATPRLSISSANHVA